MKTNKKPIWTKNFLSIAFVNLIVFIIFYALLTTLPIYVIYDLEGTEAQGGLVVTIMLLAAIIMRPFSGNLLERFGKRKVLLISTLAFAATSFGYIWVEQFIPMMILRFIHGLSFGILTTATSAIAADIVPNERKGEGLGYFTMFMNLAVVVGPFLGLTLIQSISFQQLFFILSAFVLISVICAFLVKLKDTATPTNSYRKRKLSIDDFFELKTMPIALISCLVAFAYAGILSYISVYALEIGLEKVSGYFFLVFAITMLATRPYLGRLFDQSGPKVVILPCLVMFAIGFMILSVSETAFLFLISAAVIGIGYGSLLPFLLSLSIQFVPAHRNGHATATFFTLYDTGLAAGAFVLGIVVPYTGFSNLFIYLAGFVCIITITFYVLINRLQASRETMNLKKRS
ncbi:MFS transporter [Alkalihalobacillus deserti]|uniref:MFS transporter n=1 Tax=Alkalihalobacillus deserti TaxID=2879466 RepID=UPI001D14B148|nr:MFS transporter [Alkalihalobacillus deserti]